MTAFGTNWPSWFSISTVGDEDKSKNKSLSTSNTCKMCGRVILLLNVERRCYWTSISCLSDMFEANCRFTTPYKNWQHGVNHSLRASCNGIGSPNVCRFIDDGHPAVNSRTDEDTACWNVNSPRLLPNCSWLLTVNLLLQFV